MTSPGLRERKKQKTRWAIQEHALRLIAQQGYEATTVDQIAAAAEISPSTFFRYFPTKEDLILQDDVDTQVVEAFERQPAGLTPAAAFRAALREVAGSFSQADLDVIRETAALIRADPEIRARATDEFARMITVMSEALARRSGRPADDLTVRAMAGGFIGVILSVTLPVEGWPGDDQSIIAVFERIDQALALLEAGLPL
jgi:AcrR family transcriptional regulator